MVLEITLLLIYPRRYGNLAILYLQEGRMYMDPKIIQRITQNDTPTNPYMSAPSNR